MADTQRKMMSLAAAKEHFCAYMDERILLSLAMNNIDCLYTLEARLDKMDFLSPEHSTLYTILRYMVSSMDIKSFDIPAVIDCAKNNQALDILGGSKYLYALHSMPLNPQNLNAHLEKVLDASGKYKLYCSICHANELLLANNSLAVDLVAKIETDILDLVTGPSLNEPHDLAEGVAEFLADRKENPVIQTGLSTGFPILDKQIDGLTNGALHVIAARKKMGKSAFLAVIARYVAFTLKLPVLYVDTELSFEEWRTRNIAGLSQVEERKIKHGDWNEIEAVQLAKSERIMEKNKLFHVYMPGYSVDKLIALYKKFKLKHNIALAIFDYIKEPDLKSVSGERKEYQILGDVTTKLKDMAGQLNIPVLTAVQLNRAADIADSDKIARYADIVAFWDMRDQKTLEQEKVEFGENRTRGNFKLVIKDTRRGGATPDEGITYKFKKQNLVITETLAPMQPVDYTKTVVNFGTTDTGTAHDDDTLV